MTDFPSYTTFDGTRRLACGTLLANGLALQQAQAAGALGPLLTFDDGTGQQVEIDTRGDAAALRARLAAASPGPADAAALPRGRGRPKLGVVAREVTLLPRHWAWLETQPGGASTTLRRLVEDARRASAGADARRAAGERTYRVMHALAGNLAGFEEASRALFAHDAPGLARATGAWPADVRDYVLQLADEGGAA